MSTLPLILVRISQTVGGANYQEAMAGSVLARVPTIVEYHIFHRSFVRGIALSGIEG